MQQIDKFKGEFRSSISFVKIYQEKEEMVQGAESM